MCVGVFLCDCDFLWGALHAIFDIQYLCVHICRLTFIREEKERKC